MNVEFAKKLIELRKSKKLTQKEVAKYLGCTLRKYAYQETGHLSLSCEDIINICKLYNVDTDYLFGIKKQLIYPELKNN